MEFASVTITLAPTRPARCANFCGILQWRQLNTVLSVSRLHTIAAELANSVVCDRNRLPVNRSTCILSSRYNFTSEQVGPTRMRKEEDDYFIPALAPYVQWVKAYRDLICEVYDEQKTVRKAWKAFRGAVPGIERRLEFGVFEQMLLFSLFLSEWNKTEFAGSGSEEAGRTEPGSIGHGGKYPGDQLDTVIQKLNKAIEEKERAEFNLKHHEQNALMHRERKEHFENRSTLLEENMERLRKELDAANEQLALVAHELDKYRAENTELQEQRSVSKSIKIFDRTISPKKIGRWNAQLSRDGYYRLYRKIRGKVHCIYIGRELDIEKAMRKVEEKERALLSPVPAAGVTQEQAN
ncbi:hypothetical protein SBDP1_1590041 [Syntrophobacter sp. SbD1]|nr:hypothetical protein SBDP1_1590041 [Syntrophobacter sp. SbD1]